MQIKRDVPRFMREPLLFLFFFGGSVCYFLAQKPVPENGIVSEARLREFYQYKSRF